MVGAEDDTVKRKTGQCCLSQIKRKAINGKLRF